MHPGVELVPGVGLLPEMDLVAGVGLVPGWVCTQGWIWSQGWVCTQRWIWSQGWVCTLAGGCMVGYRGTGGPQATLRLGELLRAGASCRMPSMTSKPYWAGCCWRSPVWQRCPGSSARPQQPVWGWCSPSTGSVPGWAFSEAAAGATPGTPRRWVPVGATSCGAGGAEIAERCDIRKPASRAGNPSRKSLEAGRVPGLVQTCPAPAPPRAPAGAAGGTAEPHPPRLPWGPRCCHPAGGLCWGWRFGVSPCRAAGVLGGREWG